MNRKLISLFMISLFLFSGGWLLRVPEAKAADPASFRFNNCESTSMFSQSAANMKLSNDAPQGNKSVEIGCSDTVRPYSQNASYGYHSFFNYSATYNVLGFWLKLLSKGSGADIQITWYDNVAFDRITLYIYQDTGLYYLDSLIYGEGAYFYNSTIISLNSWYWIEVAVNNATDTQVIRYNGTVLANAVDKCDLTMSRFYYPEFSLPAAGSIRLDMIRMYDLLEFPPTSTPYTYALEDGWEAGSKAFFWTQVVAAPYVIVSDSTYVKEGSYGAKYNSDAGYWTYQLANETAGTRWFGFFYKIVPNPNIPPLSDSSAILFGVNLHDGSTNYGFAIYVITSASGTNLRLVDTEDDFLNIGDMATNRWYWVRMKVMIGTSSVNATLYVDNQNTAAEPLDSVPANIHYQSVTLYSVAWYGGTVLTGLDYYVESFVALGNIGDGYVTLEAENIDGYSQWVFIEWKYYIFTLHVPNGNVLLNGNLTDVAIAFNVTTGEEEIECHFYAINIERAHTYAFYGDDEWEWTFNSTMSAALETRYGQPVMLKNGTVSYDAVNDETDVTFGIYFRAQCLDVYVSPENVWAQMHWVSGTKGWFIAATGLFYIYSKGGFTRNFVTSDPSRANQLYGEEWCALYGYNGSTVQNEIWFRDLNHIKMLPTIQFAAALDAFQISYMIEYSTGGGEWLPGWKVIVTPHTCSYTGLFAGNVWINMSCQWYQGRGTPGSYAYMKTDNIYMFYHGTVIAPGNVARWILWYDGWFNNVNASTTGGGRINAYEFAMEDNSAAWLHWLANNWGVKDGVKKESMYMGSLLDTDGNVMSVSEIKMVRVRTRLDVFDSNAGQLVVLHNYQVLDYSHSQQLPLTGIQTPVFDETKVPTVGQTGLLGAVVAGFQVMGAWLSENIIFGGLNLWGNFVSFLDTIAGWLGAPKLFSNLFKWIADGWGYFVSSSGFVFQLLSQFFLMIGSLLSAFVITLAELVTSSLRTIGFIVDIMGGGIGAAGNLWDQLGIWQWLQVAMIFYPLYLLLLWEEKGMEAVVAQLTMIWGIAAWLFGFFTQIIQVMINVIGRLIESIPVVE